MSQHNFVFRSLSYNFQKISILQSYFTSTCGVWNMHVFHFSSLHQQWWSKGEPSVVKSSWHTATSPHLQVTFPFMHGHYLQELTLAGVWIQMAALNRMWSHSCFSSGAPCVRPSRYFAKERNCSKTAPEMCSRDDCREKQKGMFINNNNNNNIDKPILL